MWGLTPSHVFVGKYPDPAWDTGEGTPYAYEPFRNQSATSMDFLCYLPGTQELTLSSGSTYLPEMTYCYMAAYGTAAPGTDVNLTFTPCVSALEIEIPNSYNNAVETFTVKKVELISATHRLNGEFSVHLADPLIYAAVTPRTVTLPSGNLSAADRTITVNFGDGVAVTSANSLIFTVFTCPVDVDDLTLRVTLANNDQQTLELRTANDGDWLTFDAFKKYHITCGTVPDPYSYEVVTDAVEYSTTPTNPSTNNAGTATIKVTSTKTKLGYTTAAPWKAQYSTDGGSTWNNWTSAVNGFSLNNYSGDGNSDGEDITVNVTTGSSSSGSIIEDYASEINALLTSNSGAYIQRGSSTDCWNLSNPTDGSITSIVETANTYIVNAPGYYCFPLVMGNGVKNNAKNTVAYQQPNFQNYQGSSLTSATSPFLQDQGGTPSAAYIVWEEADMVAHSDTWTLPAGCITSSTVSIDSEEKTVYWLNFQITDAIKQGCIILAVTDGADIMWSWNIWVTHYVPSNYSTYDANSDLADVECTYDASGNKVTFMPLNLGWVEGTLNTPATIYASTTLKVRFVSNLSGLTSAQIEASASPDITLTRPELGKPNPTGSSTLTSHNPYFQWGRKDALMPTDGSYGTPTLYGRTTTYQKTDSKQTVGTSIQNPDQQYGNGNSGSHPYDWCSIADNGWWCAGNTNTDADKVTVKTIYDPSPAGYTIPRRDAFLGFRVGTSTTPNADGSFKRGFYFYDTYQESLAGGTKTIFFPASGHRQDYNGSPSGVSTQGFYHCAVPKTSDYCNVLYILNPSVNINAGFTRCGAFTVRPALEE